MRKLQKIVSISVKYKNDKVAEQRFIEFLIELLLNENIRNEGFEVGTE